GAVDGEGLVIDIHCSAHGEKIARVIRPALGIPDLQTACDGKPEGICVVDQNAKAGRAVDRVTVQSESIDAARNGDVLSDKARHPKAADGCISSQVWLIIKCP